ncbi:MAG TPA: amidohydrolase family protein, partial [Candidatus Deferrimicrobium sp.]|nr:amidohydrolase family protein [Candidatus Deferrimicrobium sp.]
INPARILGLPRGSLAVGSPADIAIVDPSAKWTVKPENFRSRSRNSAFAGITLSGRVEKTILSGRIVFERQHSQER